MRRACWIAAALGASTVFAFAPFSLFPLPLITLGVLIALWQAAATPLRAAAIGFLFGLGFFLSGVSWVYVSLHDFGGMPAGIAALATFLFCCYLACFPALVGYLCRQFVSGAVWRDTLLVAGAWTLAELARGWLLTGFPWLALGYSQSPPSPLAGFAPVVGVFGIGFFTVALSALVAAAWSQRRLLPWVGAILLIGVVSGYALSGVQWTKRNDREVSVSLLQGNIEQSLKWRPELLERSLETYVRLARENPAELVVLPETALPTSLDALPPGYLDSLEEAAARKAGDLLLGIVTRTRDGGYLNSAVGLGRDSPQFYSKSHLVPFGEFTPRFFDWAMSLMNIPMSNFSRGSHYQSPLELAGERVAVNICYEDVFGEEIIRALPTATLLINLSNTAWFGDSLAQPQHLQIAQLRALETGRYMLRATNTGMTAAVGPDGRVIARLEPFAVGALLVSVRGHSGSTPYARSGNAPMLVVAVSALGIGLFFAVRDRTH